MAEVRSKQIAFPLRLSRTLFLVLIGGSFLGAALTSYFLIALAFALLGFFAFHLYEQKMRKSVEYLVRKRCESIGQSPEMQKEFHKLKLDMEQKQREMRNAYLEFEDMRREYHRLEEEYRLYKHEQTLHEESKASVFAEYKKTIQDQRAILEKKQIYVAQLENKVRDLMYEIRSLLQLEEPVTTALPPVDMLNREEVHDYYMGNQLPAFDLDLELSRFVDRAEQFTGADHLGSRFLKGSASYAIDLRRLFDSLRDESAGILFFYSTTENKILFANHAVKTLLGYSPEKFVNDFPALVRAGLRIWKEALARIQTTKRLTLVFVTRSGEEKKLDCELKVIEKGPFAGNIMGMIIE